VSDRIRTRTIVLIGACLALVAVVVWWAATTPSDDFVLLPERDPLVADKVVKVAGETPRAPGDEGGILYLAVVFHRASLAESWLANYEHGATVVPAQAVLPAGGDEADERRINRLAIDESKQVAAAIALRARGKQVSIEQAGVQIDDIEPNAPARRAGMRPGMVVKRIDGKPIATLRQLRAALAGKRPGDTVAVVVRDGTRTREFRVRLIGRPDRPKQALLGILARPLVRVGKLPVKVTIPTGGLGGPSAGLAFALEIYDSLDGRKLTRGRRVAVTGTIEPDGTVGEIGGAKQKAIGAAAAGAALMLAPDGNAAEARKNAGDMPVVAVSTFSEALAAIRRLDRAS
jgi:Lon-like protease